MAITAGFERLLDLGRSEPDNNIPAGPAGDSPETADLPAVTGPEPSGDGAAAELVAAASAFARMSYGQQVAEGLRHVMHAARRRAEEERQREGSWLHRLMNEPVSVRGVYVYADAADLDGADIYGVCDYAQSRSWVAPGHDGGVMEKAGVLYFALIGRPKVTYHRLQIWKAERPLRWAVWQLIRFALAMIILAVCGHGRLAAEISAGLLTAIVVAAALLMPRRPGGAESETEEEEDPS